MQIKKNFFIFIFIIIVFLATGFFLINHSPKNFEPEDIKYVEIARKTLKVGIALTKEEQKEGLSGKDILRDDEGMLFVFSNPEKYAFWMKNMNFPIDIIWIGEDLRVIYVKKDARPESYPEVFVPTENATYVLEVISGFVE
ncbi:DUF192 domain-containing protein, partial [Patescibacteria group bacterium]|nr:DUF192 domain-containing protein [Patescibacteria group bacterium]